MSEIDATSHVEHVKHEAQDPETTKTAAILEAYYEFGANNSGHCSALAKAISGIPDGRRTPVFFYLLAFNRALRETDRSLPEVRIESIGKNLRISFPACNEFGSSDLEATTKPE